MSETETETKSINPPRSTAETILTDSLGRKLRVRSLSVVEQYRLAKAVGSETAENPTAFSMAQTAAAVRSISNGVGGPDVPMWYPSTDKEVEHNIELLGDEGYAAFMLYFKEQVARVMEAAKKAGDAGPFGPIRALVRFDPLRDALYLVKHGVPFDVATTLPEDERVAYCIIFGEMDGGTFDWGRRRWKEPG